VGEGHGKGKGGILGLLVTVGFIIYAVIDHNRTRRRRQADTLLRLMEARNAQEIYGLQGEALGNGIVVLTDEDFRIWRDMQAHATQEEKLHVLRTVHEADNPAYILTQHISRWEVGLRPGSGGWEQFTAGRPDNPATPTPAPGTSASPPPADAGGRPARRSAGIPYR